MARGTTVLGTRPTVLGATPTVLGATHTVLGATPTVLGATPTVLGANPTVMGVTPFRTRDYREGRDHAPGSANPAPEVATGLLRFCFAPLHLAIQLWSH